MSDPTVYQYIIPSIKKISKQVNTTLTDSFCVIGCTSFIDNDTNIINGGPPLGYTYDGINYHASSSTLMDQVNKVDFNGYQWVAFVEQI
jgi:hypothetical protein